MYNLTKKEKEYFELLINCSYSEDVSYKFIALIQQKWVELGNSEELGRKILSRLREKLQQTPGFMLQRNMYKELWDDHFKSLAIRRTLKENDNPNNCPDDNYDYLIRENMFEDYLDIFRGKDTRKTRGPKLCSDWYYPHPFFNEIGELIDSDGNKLTKQTLKYVMIGEAAPSSGETYFYNINHLDSTSWLSAPVKAFRDSKPTRIAYAKPTNSNEKINLLLELAKEGYLLIDLFPFSLKFTSNIRKKLNSKGVSDFFYKRLQTKIGDILIGLKEDQNADIYNSPHFLDS